MWKSFFSLNIHFEIFTSKWAQNYFMNISNVLSLNFKTKCYGRTWISKRKKKKKTEIISKEHFQTFLKKAMFIEIAHWNVKSKLKKIRYTLNGKYLNYKRKILFFNGIFNTKQKNDSFDVTNQKAEKKTYHCGYLFFLNRLVLKAHEI